MWCSNISCGVEGTGNFCQQCGAKMVKDRSADSVVICRGKLSNGSSCNAELDRSKNFCSNCGAKVDHSLFARTTTTCQKCGAELEKGSPFCSHCGEKQSEPGQPVVEQQPVLVPGKSCDSERKEPSEDKDNSKTDQETGSKDKIDIFESSVPTEDTENTKMPQPNVKAERLNLLPSVTKEEEVKHEEESKHGPVCSNSVEQTIEHIEESPDDSKQTSKPVETQDTNTDTKNAESLNTLDQKEIEEQTSVEIKTPNEPKQDVDAHSDSSELSSESESDSKYGNEESESKQSENISEDLPEKHTATSGQVKNKKRRKPKKKRKKGKGPDDDNLKKIGKINENAGKEQKDGKIEETQEKVLLPDNQHTTTSSEQKVFGAAKDWGLLHKGGSVEISSPNSVNAGNTQPVFPPLLKDMKSEAGKSNGENKKTQQVNVTDDDVQGTTEAEENSENDLDEVEEKGEGANGSEASLSRRQKRNLKLKQEKENNRKKDEKNMANKNKNAQNQNRSKSGAAGDSNQNEKVTHVFFHTIISEDFKFDPDKHKLILCMEDEYNKWDNMTRVCRVKKKLNDHVYEMEFDMKIPRSRICFGKRTQYKYCIVRPEKPEKEQYIWEHYLKDGHSGEKANRTLTLIDRWRDIDVWHQYDGYVVKELSAWDRVTSMTLFWKKELVKYAKNGIDYFCSRIFEAEDSYSMSWCLEQLEVLLSCFKRIFFHDAKCWDYKEERFKEEIGRNVLEKLLAIAGSCDSTIGLSPEKRERQVVISIGAIYVAKKLDIPFADIKNWQKICKNMIMIPDKKTKRCLELQTLDKYFPEKRKPIVESIIALAKHIARNSKNPSWLFLMPWIHFMSGLCNPFDSPPFDDGHNKPDPLWWGVTQIGDDSVKYFESKTDKWEISVEDTLAYIEPIFEMDFYLPRTFVTAVRLKELSFVIKTGMIPLEVCLASLFYQVVNTRPIMNYDYYKDCYSFGSITSDERVVEECLKTLKTVLSRSGEERTPGNSHQEKMGCYFSTQLLIECTKADRGTPVGCSIGIMLQCLSEYAGKSEDQEKYAITLLNRCMTETKRWIDIWCYNWKHYMENILQTWNSFYSPVGIEQVKIKNLWNEEISKALSERIESMVFLDSWTMTSFVELYCQKVDSYNLAMQDCLSKAAFKAIEKGYAVDYARFKGDGIRRFGDLVSNLFLKEWEKYDATQALKDILEHFLGWPPFAHFVKIYSKDQKKLELLSRDCLERLVQAISAVQNCTELLFKGEINIGTLRLLQSNEVNFAPIAEMVQLKKEHSKDLITKAVQIRQKEIEAFNRQAELMTTLTSLCQHIANVDRVAVDRTLSKKKDLDKHKVNEFCKPADVTTVQNVEAFQPFLCAFRVSVNVLQMLPDLKRCSESNIFMKFWIAECESVQEGLTLNDVVSVVWQPAKSRWDTAVQHIINGDIKFQEFENLLGNLYKEDYEKIETEMKTLVIKDNIIKKRVDQLKKFRQLNTCAAGAKIIVKFAKDFDLKGDFQQIKIIALNAENDIEMKSFDDSVMNACDFLKHLNKERVNCLNTFVKCRPLVQWLRASMSKAGLKELKVFVDLAFMSAGDEPMNIKRVQCLHSAVTGYAPIIFELKETSGYKDLLRLCAVVWKELEANPSLPQMLIDTNKELQWLKDVKKAHGSVEVTSLMQAEAVNAYGIYTIGKNAWKNDPQKQAADGTLLVAADVVQLTVPEKEEKRQLRNYTFSQLQDLQSRLMLVAGKAEKSTDSVDRFTMIFDSITRLSNVYIKLCSSGCVLFKDFTARFLCDHERPVCVILTFGQGDRVPQLKGRRSLEEDLEIMIPELAKFLETCLEDWLRQVKEKRNSYLHLNYFTVDQLVILQRELVKIGTEDAATHLIYPLLSAVKENCSPGDLIEAMTAAKEEIENELSIEPEREESNESEATVIKADDSEEVRGRKFVLELVEAGCNETLAYKALEVLGPEDVTQGIIWCMDHEENAVSDDSETAPILENLSKSEEPAQGSTFTGWSQSTKDIQTIIAANISGLQTKDDVGSKPLIEELSALWKMFLESISSSIRDYLTLEHLGIILKYLAQKSQKEICRSLPPGFIEGQPNLVICPSADVLMSTLSMYSMNEDQPLPQSDEVLMCTASTTKDEIDIFWRRAIFDSGNKIHCLVNADMLDYDISEAAERCLDEYLQQVHFQGLKYRLVVICGSDNEYRSGIVSSLDKFRRQRLPTNASRLRVYLLNKLTIQQTTVNGVKPAALVDRDRSTVRLIKSWRAGVGKTLFKQRRENELLRLNRRDLQTETVSIPLQEKTIDLHGVIGRFLEHTLQPEQAAARIFHIDVTHEVQNGVDYLLFNLLVLGSLVDKRGFVWRKSQTDLYLVETMPLMMQSTNRRVGDLQYVHIMLEILPDLTCRSPQESLEIYQGHRPKDYKESDQLFDEHQFSSAVFQRTFQYLLRLDQGRQLEDVNPQTTEGTPQTCLQTLLRHCGLKDPSWSELHHFVWFLNTQLVDFEKNSFVSAAAAEDLPGFTKFVLRFLITMSRDFSTRSLNMSEESPGLKKGYASGRDAGNDMDVEEAEVQEDDLQAYQMRRTWESSPHPYLFFNSDRFTFTFLGFFIDRATGNLIDSQTMTVLDRGIMAQNLYDSLVRNHAPMQENFDALPRDQKITKLCNVMGIEFPHDPDDTYELTTDNVKKILAIYMRFRCDIPVIIMGETGCGKTRLVKFMCALQIPPGVNMTSMILMKVHGGTTNKDIIRNVREAEKLAKFNRKEFGQYVYTVLFFDEANTTETIGLIKEIMCDRSLEGKKLKLCENLKMVAACNPYRKHSDKLIRKLEQAGLGYHVDADETEDRLGRVPMRRLVYRVQPLPQSLLPLVWDFGQLNTQVEDLYIRQMVKRYIRDDKLPDIPNLKETVSAVLTASQDYMRAQKDECSFVSLRDVDRVLTVMSWFYQQSQGDRTLYGIMDRKLHNLEPIDYSDKDEDEDEEDFDRDIPNRENQVDDLTRSMILALGVCYHACLRTRQQYRAHVARFFQAPCQLPGGADQIKDEIECCQEAFLDNVLLEKNIARNTALTENVFMMVVCIELRIPLFLVGKPGSSKSLAKTIVSDAMQGNAARQILFRELKQAQMVSFQCSPLSTPDGIVNTFHQCARFQKDKDLDTFVSIVVLDEVGLAEDSPRMPLKTLHPLLEDGCQGDETPEKHKKVAFIGISNWALDPAKMNRGILVQREVPDLEELKNSASGICHTDDELGSLIKPLIEPMAKSYLKIFEKAAENMREFFGLRDFYSLVKMVYGFVEKSKQPPTWHEMLHAIKRNFGGLDQVDPVVYFRQHLATLLPLDTRRLPTDPDCTPSGLIQACLFDKKNESRYLLLLTENYGALSIIQQQILSRGKDIHPITIFGSSFRSDQEYTQVCRNINKIKVCMETGNTVVLLNLENLYESLYDALNQYYVYFGGERFVDLGLGTHRVKCTVHKNFRLIVVAEKQTVYKKFPIPLINRLEKHFLTINTMLTPEQQNVVKKLEEWARQFITQMNSGVQLRKNKFETKIGDVFIGYHEDTCSAIVLDEWGKTENIGDLKDRENQVLQKAKFVLLWCATPESLYKLKNSILPKEEITLLKKQYSDRQQHENVMQYLQHFIGGRGKQQLLAQVTTHSKLLAGTHKTDLSKATGITVDQILLLETLSSFDTEQQFSNRILQHMKSSGNKPSLMVIQCDSGDQNANLIACARYCVSDELERMNEELHSQVHVVFIVQLPRGANFTGFQCGVWHSAHIDDLYPEDTDTLSLHEMHGRSVARIFSDAVKRNGDRENANDIQLESLSRQEIWTGEERNADSEISKSASLQLDDIRLQIQTTADDRRLNKTYRLGIKTLILNCVQAAMSMVKDRSENSKRETARVSLVLKLLHKETDSGNLSFLNGVCSLTAKLLQEKELTLLEALAEDWLINEAASNENINKAGTFRRSCLQTLVGKVSPILAGIIAYLDTNENLSILEEAQSAWKKDLWLKFLNSTDVLNLKLSDLLSPARQIDLQEVFVVSTGCENHMFGAKMPFSWLLINQINEILSLTKQSGLRSYEEERTENTRLEYSVGVLRDSPAGRLISRYSDDQSVIEAIKDYVEDFVHTFYNAASDQEHQLVVRSLHFVASQTKEENSLIHGLVQIHIGYEILSPRLAYFRAMNSVWPQCSSVIIDLRTKNPDHFMFQEQEFTFSALCLLIENLTPKEIDLNTQQGRSKWLTSVHKYRPVVEKVIALHGEDPHLYGNHSLESVRRAKCLWSRVMVVKLFLENICTVDKEDKITIKHCMPLWGILGDEADLKRMRSLTGVEKFLKICNKQAVKEYLGSEEKCCLCESVLEGPPITLPCKDVLCDQCYNGMRGLGENTCGKCQTKFPEKWEPARQAANKAATERLKDFQKRCNTFFMEVVSQLCFAESTAPSREVVNKLLGYIFFTTKNKFQSTKDMTIFDTGIDPNPVFRSFLLQHLMRTSKNNVMENLSSYFEQADGLIRREKDNAQQYVELSLLVIQCLEDIFAQEVSSVDTDEVEYAIQALDDARQQNCVASLTVEKLYGLANARMGLAIVAKYIAEIVIDNLHPGQVEYHVRKMIETASILCDTASVQWYRVYLVKYLCRYYGVDVYQAICCHQAPFLRWIRIKQINREQVVEVSDRFIVSGDNYITVRESVTKIVLGEDMTHLTDKLQELQTAGVRVEPLLHLALYREVTSSNLYPNEQRKLTGRVLQNIEEFINNCQMIKNKQLLRAVIHNQLVPRNLVLQQGEDLRRQGIQCLIFHFLVVMTQFQGDRTLLQPLKALIGMPQSMTNAFLPTMPQDDLEEVKQALLAARNRGQGSDTNPVIYRCPNGHPYVIGDCGRPATVGQCKDCGAVIGGVGHTLRPGNVQDAGVDTSVTGHILGRAHARGRGAQPERELTPAFCSAARMLLHMAMYLGAGTNRLGIQHLIKPSVMENQVEDFVWDHIIRDVDDMHISLGVSVDDVMLLMHAVVNNIFRMHNEGERVAVDVCQWSSKSGRRKWETNFSLKYLQSVFQNQNHVLKTHNQQLAEDKRLGVDPLLRLLYETDTNTDMESAASIEKVPRVWRYRIPISLQHLRQEVQAKLGQNEHKVLQLFLQEEHILRALRYIPSILRLHRTLFQKYQRKLDKAEASQITVARLLKEKFAGEESEQMLHDFAEAWELVRRSLNLYLCPTEKGGETVSKEYCCEPISDNTTVAMLLPTTKEAGLCSYALLDFLIRKQNDFLDKYLKNVRRTSISTVKPKEVTSAHLISYDPQHDIMPLILANCHYSFEMGKGTKIEYDFASLERQLMDRLLFSKSRVDVGKFLQIDLMVYRTEFTNAEVFRKLAEKIPQETLGTVVKTQIISEFRSLPDLCQSLDNLDITISFLKSTGGPQDKMLYEFMVKTLQMKYPMHSQTAQQACEFRHAQSLWLLLSLQKAKKMTDNHQLTESTFESVSAEFHQELPEELFTVFEEYALKKLSVEKLTQLVEVLHEYILLVVAVRQKPEDEDYIDTTNNKLCDWLQGFIEVSDPAPLDTACLVDFPQEILFKHSVHTWVSAYNFLRQKQTGKMF